MTALSVHVSQVPVAKRWECLDMQGVRLRATEAYFKYVEEPDGSETQQIQAFPPLQ